MAKYLQRARYLYSIKGYAMGSWHPPVYRNATQMHYAGSGEVNIEAVPDVAHERAKHPSARYLDGGIESHCTEGDQHVGHRQ